ncbi:exocyst complex component, sec3 subunit [Cyathus striatus]|nr:exocyst complex component, sec3 subunit [Cyathus striatus]
MADQRQNIISSVFSKRNASGSLEETYVSHVKIWEDAGTEGGGRKPRYILLSQANNGTGFIHKSKLNTNGTFSVGKTWKLAELRAIQVLNPLAFNITLSRTYRWQTENQIDQANFLEALIRLFHTITQGSAPLHLEGIHVPDVDPGAPPAPRSPRVVHPRTPSQESDNYHRGSPVAPSPLRNGLPGVTSSVYSTSNTVASSLQKNRPPSITVPSASGSLPTVKSRQPHDAGTNGIAAQSSSALTNAASKISSYSQGNMRNSLKSDISSKNVSQDSTLLSSVPTRTASPTPLGRPRKISARPGNAPQLTETLSARREQNARISFFDPTNQVAVDRLLSGTTLDNQVDVDNDEADAQATLASVEEMIEGYEWASEDVIGRKTTRGAVDLIEARLVDELTALEKANVHSFLESDDRVSLVMQYMDEAIAELDNMDSLISSYKIHLNAVSDDISFIQSQNRGLQVQTQNQRALLAELQNLLRTVHVDEDALVTLTQESLEKSQSIQRLEEAASELYKALQAGRESDMAATMERLQEYRTHNSQFCKRMFDFLTIMFTAQSKLLLGDSNGLTKASGGRLVIVQHQDIETYLGRYAGLMLYLKEMDESIYGRLCAAYFSAASELHSTQVRTLFSSYMTLVKKTADEDNEQSFSAAPITATSKGVSGIRRAGTIIRSPIEGRNKDKDKNTPGDLRASEVFGMILEQLAPQVYQEYDFITDFLQINDAALTFADYMGLDSYFKRQASRAAGLSQTTLKLVRGALDLIFGFLSGDLKAWVDNALSRDSLEVIGMIATLERFQAEAEERNNEFFLNVLGKQHLRLKATFDRHINDQLKDIEQTKLTSKKRKGAAHFIKHFPVYVNRVENQLIGADGLDIRTNVDVTYEKIVQSMFDSLKQMAKLEGEGEDKGQLNYHVILIENMHYFVAEMSKLDVVSTATFSKKAEAVYDENLSAYIKIIFRRPFGKIIDYFEGLDQLLKSTPASEINSNAAFNKSALKKVIKEYTVKDIRKHIDVLFRRVEKHFTEASEKPKEEGGGITAGTVLVGVWKSCEDELLKMTQQFSERISQCYGDSNLSLDYAKTDIEVAFRKQRISST